MSPSATPATSNEGRCRQVPRNGAQARHQSQPSATSATSDTPATWNEVAATQNVGGCRQVPRLPRKTKVDVSKWHACHSKCRGAPGDERRPSTPPCRASPVPQAPRLTRNAGSCRQVQRLPRKWNVDVTSSTPATQSAAAPRATNGDQARASPVPQVPRLPRKENVCRCHQVPHLPGKTKVDVTKWHACHAKCRGVTGDWRPAPATQRECGCLTVPRLPRKTKVNVAKCHACHVKRRWMLPSATPATRSVP